MSSISSKEIVVRHWYQELWDRWNIATADTLLTDDYRLHIPGVPDGLSRDATKQVVAMFSKAFPDLKHTVDEMIAEGETIAARWTVHGTHQGEFQRIVATGNQVSLSGNTFHHMRGEKILETWLSFDSAALMQQITASQGVAKV